MSIQESETDRILVRLCAKFARLCHRAGVVVGVAASAFLFTMSAAAAHARSKT
jgi:hypothetical protein